MKKFIAITSIVAIALATFAFVGCFDCNADEDVTVMPFGPIMGEIHSIDGYTLTLRIVEVVGGETRTSGNDEIEIVGEPYDEDEIAAARAEYGIVAGPEPIDWEELGGFEYNDEELEFGEVQRPGARIAGADAETDRIRIADAEEGAVIRTGEGGGNMLVAGDEMPEVRFTGEVQTITLPRGTYATVGVNDDETHVAVSTLNVGNIVLIMYNVEGAVDFVRVMPFWMD